MVFLKFKRIESGLTQGELSRRASVPRPYLTMMEAGRLTPRPMELVRLAKVLGVSDPSDLMKHVDSGSLGEAAEFKDAQRGAKS